MNYLVYSRLIEQLLIVLPQRYVTFLTFKVEVVMPIKVGLPSYCIAHFSYEQNDNNLKVELYVFKEM